MARVRVYTQVGGGQKVPMVGYVPRPLLDEIRRRLREAVESGEKEVSVAASPKRADRVRVVFPSAARFGEAHPAWRIFLGVRVRSGAEEERPSPVPAKIMVELRELVREAERVAESAAEKDTAVDIVDVV